MWHRCKYVVAGSGDKCSAGSWVFATSPIAVSASHFKLYIEFPSLTPLQSSNPPITGRILDILKDSAGPSMFVIINVFQLAATRHKIFGMPILKH